MTFKKQEYIEIEDVFSEIGSIEDKHFAEINKDDSSWAIDVARNKVNLLDGKKVIDRLILCTRMKGETSQLREISEKIDGLKSQLTDIIV